MKKIFYILAFALSCSFYQSCVNEEEDIFDNTYDTRVNEHCENALNVLTSNPNGWEMLYFLNNELSIPSYTLLADFKKEGKSGSAKFAIKADVTGNKYVESDYTSFDMTTSNGPMISFSLYNDVLHMFSDPEPNGKGLMGENDFRVISATNDEVVLTGNKYGAVTILRPLKEGQNWEEYFDTILDDRNTLFVKNPAPIRLHAGDNVYDLFDGSSYSFNVVEGGTDLAYGTRHKFLQTNRSIRLQDPLYDNGVYLGQEFFFSEDRTELYAYDSNGNKIGYIDSGSPLAFYNSALSSIDLSKGTPDYHWLLDGKNLGGKVKEEYDKMVDYFESLPRPIREQAIKIYLSSSSEGHILLMVFGTNKIWIKLNKEDNGDISKFILTDTKSKEDGNYRDYDTYIENNQPIQPFVDMFKDMMYQYSYLKIFDGNTIKMTSVQSESDYMHIKYTRYNL